MATRDFYEILGVSKSATSAEIKRAYRKKALEHHPDRNKSTEAEAKFKEINEAYEVLSNPQKRQTYDQFGPSAFHPGSGFSGGGSPFSQTGRAGPFTYTYTTSGGGNPFAGFDFGGFSDPFDIFESFFGGTTPFGRRGPAKPHYTLKISLEEAFKGTEKNLVHQGKSHKIKIPPGSSEGTRIRYSGFDVSIDVLPHNTFKRDGVDLFLDHKIPFTAAALGSLESIPTLEGKVQIKIRPGTQPGTLIRLRGQGMPHLQSRSRGDQYVRLVIDIPKSLSHEQKQLLEKLHQLS